MDMWLRELNEMGVTNLPTFVVGNKKDQSGMRAVGKDDASNWAK